MKGCRYHYPKGEGGYTRPHGTRAECAVCGRPIVFIEGYAFRQDYWRAVSRTVDTSRRQLVSS